MADLATISKTPKILPYFESAYRASFSTPGWFYEHLHISSARKIERALEEAEIDRNEDRPSPAAISGVVGLVDDASRVIALSEPVASVFQGEAILTWKCGRREVTVLSRGGPDDPKILYYEARTEPPSYHEIVRGASWRDLRKAIRWLYE